MRGRALVDGTASGELVYACEPLSFWGGYSERTGEIIDRRHPLCGRIAAGRILAIPRTVGSSTTTAILLEAVRAGVAPAAILTRQPDSFLALASIVAGEMYGKTIPVVALTTGDYDSLEDGMWIRLEAGGALIRISGKPVA